MTANSDIVDEEPFSFEKANRQIQELGNGDKDPIEEMKILLSLMKGIFKNIQKECEDDPAFAESIKREING